MYALCGAWCVMLYAYIDMYVYVCVCLGQAARGQRSRPKEAGRFLQGAGGPSGGEGKKL